MNHEIYLDYGSATPIHPAAEKAAEAASATFADPLQHHAAGRRSRDILEEARQSVAAAIRAQPDEIVLTSGGTESVTLAVRGVAMATSAGAAKGGRIVVGAVEHPSVLGAARALAADGFETIVVPVDEFGRLDLDVFVAEARKPGTVLACIQHANHELGTLQPVAEAARLSREAGVPILCDACQTIGRLPINVEALGLDLLAVSAHKFGGPPGAGALYVRRGVALTGSPSGDDRERRRRSGMENVPGAAGMAAALSAAIADIANQAAAQWSFTDRLRNGLAETAGARLHGHATQRAPHLVCFSIPDIDAEVLLMALDDRGFRLAAGSVASGNPHDPSPVLEAIGVRDASPIRAGVGRDTTEEDIDALLATLPELVAELRKMQEASSEALKRLRRQDA